MSATSLRSCRLSKRTIVYRVDLSDQLKDQDEHLVDCQERCDALRALSCTRWDALGELRPSDIQHFLETSASFLADCASALLRRPNTIAKAVNLGAIDSLCRAAFGAAEAAYTLQRAAGAAALFRDLAAALQGLVCLAEACLDLVKALLRAEPQRVSDAIARCSVIGRLAARLAGVSGGNSGTAAAAGGCSGGGGGPARPLALSRKYCGEYLLALVAYSDESAAAASQMADAFWDFVAAGPSSLPATKRSDGESSAPGPAAVGAGGGGAGFMQQCEFYLTLRLLSRIVDAEKPPALAPRLPALLRFALALDARAARGARAARQALEYVLHDVLLRLAACAECRAALAGAECRTLLAELNERAEVERERIAAAAAAAAAIGYGSSAWSSAPRPGSSSLRCGTGALLLRDCLPGLAASQVMMGGDGLFECGWWS